MNYKLNNRSTHSNIKSDCFCLTQIKFATYVACGLEKTYSALTFNGFLSVLQIV